VYFTFQPLYLNSKSARKIIFFDALSDVFLSRFADDFYFSLLLSLPSLKLDQ